jgi:hypothetical protein
VSRLGVVKPKLCFVNAYLYTDSKNSRSSAARQESLRVRLSRRLQTRAEMVDYRRFDAIESDSDEEGDIPTPAPKLEVQQPPLAAAPRHPEQTAEPMTKKSKEGRIKFEHNGRTVYEWEQSLTEVNLYLTPPPGVPSKQFEIVISHRHLKIGLKGAPPFIDEDTGGPVIPDDSLWTLTDGELNVNLQKMNKAEMWDCALVGQKGSKLDAFTQEETRKKLMLERFQEEVRCSLCNPRSARHHSYLDTAAPGVRFLRRGFQWSSPRRSILHGWS